MELSRLVVKAQPRCSDQKRKKLNCTAADLHCSSRSTRLTFTTSVNIRHTDSLILSKTKEKTKETVSGLLVHWE